MGMGQDHIGNDLRIKGHDPVFSVAFLAPALKHAAIEKNLIPFIVSRCMDPVTSLAAP